MSNETSRITKALAEDQKKEEKKSQEGKIEELEREVQELKLRVQCLESLQPD